MAELEQVVSGEWFEIRERIHHSDQLFKFLADQEQNALTTGLWDATAEDLERSIEGGVFEFKRRRLVVQLAKLEEAAYTSELFSALTAERIATTAVLMVCATERALLSGEISFLGDSDTPDDADQPAEESEQTEPDQPGDRGSDETEVRASAGADSSDDIKRIVNDVQEIVASDPTMKMNSAIKNILLQLQKYREEAATYQKLKEQATSYRMEMYSKTFTASFARIFESIRKNYESFLVEQAEIRRRRRGSVLDGIDAREWVRLLQRQMEAINRIRSTFLFVEREHAGMREPLVALGQRKKEIIALFDREVELVDDLAGGEDAGQRLGRIIAVEIARRLRYWSRR